MPDYQNAKIYKIINDQMPDKVYYGATCNTFAKRLSQHKTESSIRRCTSKVLFEYGNPQMILVEKFPCNDKLELTQRERYYIENNECVNKYIPCRTPKEYYVDNQEKILLKKKEYYVDNKEKIGLRDKKYREANKEKVALRKKEYYINNKEKILLQKNKMIKIDCKCGSTYTHSTKIIHLKSNKHLRYIQKS